MRPASGFSPVALLAAAAAILSLVHPQDAHAVGTVAGTLIQSQASMSYKDVNNNSYSATSNTVTATVSEVYAVSLNCPVRNQSTNSGTTTYYACTVTNTGNAKNTFTLVATSSPLWTTLIYRDDGAGGGTANDGIHTAGETTETGSTGEIDPDTSYKFFVATTVPANKENAATAASTLAVTGTKDATAADDAGDTLTTTALAPAISVVKNLRTLPSGTFGLTTSAKPLETLEYRVEVTNSGTVEATEVVLLENLNANLEYVAGSMRYSATDTYAGASVLTDAATGDAGCNAVHECGTATFSGGLLTFRLGANATEAAGGALGTTKTVYLFFHAKVK